MIQFIKNILFLKLFFLSLSLHAQIDVLDELERKTLNDEKSASYSEDLPIFQKEDPKRLDSQKKSKKQRVKNSDPNRTSSKIASLDDIQKNLNILSNEIDALSLDVENTKKLIYKRSKDDNYLKILLSLPPSETAGIQSISVKLDGFSIFDQINTFSRSLEQKDLPIFFGQIAEGSHFLDVEVSFFKKQDELSELSELPLKKEQKRFDIQTDKKTEDYILILHSDQPAIEIKKAST